MVIKTDFLVIGSGIAGLHSALILANHGKVLLVTKQSITDSATEYAQGGIAAVYHKNDSVDSHIEDTLKAGKFHNNKERVSFLVKNGKKAILELEKYGINFDKNDDGSFATSYEAAHSFPRIFHASDFTGREIEKQFTSLVKQNKNIQVWENTFSIDLYVKNNACLGAFVLQNNKIISLSARGTILCTGGTGHIYTWTTNPTVATGDGLAMAIRAGAKLSDLEFIQFHPTALKGNASPLFLLSEALRGEGAILTDSKGNQFMQAIHPLKDLAPRDIVSQAVFKKQREGTVFLEFRNKQKNFIINRFPNIYKELKKRGFDLSSDRIPITPAAHFLCGGITTDLYGRTSVHNLFAYGEVAATGIHGANRLASNSLLEGFIFSGEIEHVLSELPQRCSDLPTDSSFKTIPDDNTNIRSKIQNLMWNYVGIERSKKNLLQAVQELTVFLKSAQNNNTITREKGELINILQVASQVAKSALSRDKSLGSHLLLEENQ